MHKDGVHNRLWWYDLGFSNSDFHSTKAKTSNSQDKHLHGALTVDDCGSANPGRFPAASVPAPEITNKSCPWSRRESAVVAHEPADRNTYFSASSTPGWDSWDVWGEKECEVLIAASVIMGEIGYKKKSPKTMTCRLQFTEKCELLGVGRHGKLCHRDRSGIDWVLCKYHVAQWLPNISLMSQAQGKKTLLTLLQSVVT